jgi:hypothetical protein
MDLMVWILAGIFLVNAVTVAILGIVVEVRRRRDQHEVRELELLYEAPSAAPVPVAVLRRFGGTPQGKHAAMAVAAQGKHVAVAETDPRRGGTFRNASFALAIISVGVVVAAAFVTPARPGGTTSAASDRVAAGGSVPRPTIDPGESTNGSAPRYVPIDSPSGRQGAIDEPIDLDAPGANVVESGGEPTVPAVVVAAPASATSIRIDWEPVLTATGYVVDRWVESGPDSEIGWLTIAQPEAGVSTVTDTGLDSATTYYYRVTAVLQGGAEALASDVVSATTMIPPPDVPMLSVRVAGNNVVLHWTDVENETAYRVERLVPGATQWTLLATTAADVVSVKDLDTSASGMFQYRVIATGLGGDSQPSDIVQIDPSVSIGEPPPSPEEPEPSETAPDATEPAETAPGAIDPAETAPDAIEPDEASSD